jgi:hypothetical protein
VTGNESKAKQQPRRSAELLFMFQERRDISGNRQLLLTLLAERDASKCLTEIMSKPMMAIPSSAKLLAYGECLAKGRDIIDC